MGDITSIFIQIEITNFLKFMENIESASLHTLKSYKNDLAQVFGPMADDKVLPEAQILPLTRKALNRWAKLSPASKNRKASVIKSFFNYLYREKKISHPLTEHIYTAKVPKKIPNYISVDEAISVLKNTNDQDRLLFLLLYGGGLRVSEACSLSWKQVNLSQGQLRILGKGNKERIIAIPLIVINELFLVSKNITEKFVWGKLELHPRKAYELIQKLGIRTNLLKPLHPHALRHSFATHLLTSGANLRTLQELLGHQSLQATEKYTHLGIDQLARTLEKCHPLGSK